MTPEERSILSNFLANLEQTRPSPKDSEAAGLIEAALGRNPDAAYVLVQHAILANRALQDATARINDLEAQVRGSGSRSSFLGGSPLLDRPSGPWGPTTAGAAAAAAAPQAGSVPRVGGGLGSFLGNAATTAAGVAGGALLFEGLSSLFGGGRGGWGLGGTTPYEVIDTMPQQQADFSSVDDQIADTGSQNVDVGGDFSSFDDSIG
jgi:hypothetical protein